LIYGCYRLRLFTVGLITFTRFGSVYVVTIPRLHFVTHITCSYPTRSAARYTRRSRFPTFTGHFTVPTFPQYHTRFIYTVILPIPHTLVIHTVIYGYLRLLVTVCCWYWLDLRLRLRCSPRLLRLPLPGRRFPADWLHLIYVYAYWLLILRFTRLVGPTFGWLPLPYRTHTHTFRVYSWPYTVGWLVGYLYGSGYTRFVHTVYTHIYTRSRSRYITDLRPTTHIYVTYTTPHTGFVTPVVTLPRYGYHIPRRYLHIYRLLHTFCHGYLLPIYHTRSPFVVTRLVGYVVHYYTRFGLVTLFAFDYVTFYHVGTFTHVGLDGCYGWLVYGWVTVGPRLIYVRWVGRLFTHTLVRLHWLVIRLVPLFICWFPTHGLVYTRLLDYIVPGSTVYTLRHTHIHTHGTFTHVHIPVTTVYTRSRFHSSTHLGLHVHAIYTLFTVTRLVGLGWVHSRLGPDRSPFTVVHSYTRLDPTRTRFPFPHVTVGYTHGYVYRTGCYGYTWLHGYTHTYGLHGCRTGCGLQPHVTQTRFTRLPHTLPFWTTRCLHLHGWTIVFTVGSGSVPYIYGFRLHVWFRTSGSRLVTTFGSIPHYTFTVAFTFTHSLRFTHTQFRLVGWIVGCGYIHHMLHAHSYTHPHSHTPLVVHLQFTPLVQFTFCPHPTFSHTHTFTVGLRLDRTLFWLHGPLHSSFICSVYTFMVGSPYGSFSYYGTRFPRLFTFYRLVTVATVTHTLPVTVGYLRLHTGCYTRTLRVILLTTHISLPTLPFVTLLRLHLRCATRLRCYLFTGGYTHTHHHIYVYSGSFTVGYGWFTFTVRLRYIQHLRLRLHVYTRTFTLVTLPVTFYAVWLHHTHTLPVYVTLHYYTRWLLLRRLHTCLHGCYVCSVGCYVYVVRTPVAVTYHTHVPTFGYTLYTVVTVTRTHTRFTVTLRCTVYGYVVVALFTPLHLLRLHHTFYTHGCYGCWLRLRLPRLRCCSPLRLGYLYIPGYFAFTFTHTRVHYHTHVPDCILFGYTTHHGCADPLVGYLPVAFTLRSDWVTGSGYTHSSYLRLYGWPDSHGCSHGYVPGYRLRGYLRLYVAHDLRFYTRVTIRTTPFVTVPARLHGCYVYLRLHIFTVTTRFGWRLHTLPRWFRCGPGYGSRFPFAVVPGTDIYGCYTFTHGYIQLFTLLVALHYDFGLRLVGHLLRLLRLHLHGSFFTFTTVHIYICIWLVWFTTFTHICYSHLLQFGTLDPGYSYTHVYTVDCAWLHLQFICWLVGCYLYCYLRYVTHLLLIWFIYRTFCCCCYVGYTFGLLPRTLHTFPVGLDIQFRTLDPFIVIWYLVTVDLHLPIYLHTFTSCYFIYIPVGTLFSCSCYRLQLLLIWHLLLLTILVTFVGYDWTPVIAVGWLIPGSWLLDGYIWDVIYIWRCWFDLFYLTDPVWFVLYWSSVVQLRLQPSDCRTPHHMTSPLHFDSRTDGYGRCYGWTAGCWTGWTGYTYIRCITWTTDPDRLQFRLVIHLIWTLLILTHTFHITLHLLFVVGWLLIYSWLTSPFVTLVLLDVVGVIGWLLVGPSPVTFGPVTIWFGWYSHVVVGYVTDFTHCDLVFVGHSAGYIRFSWLDVDLCSGCWFG